MTLYRKVFTKDRLPEKDTTYLTDNGVHLWSCDMQMWVSYVGKDKPVWFMELVDLPTEEQIKSSHGLTIIPHMVNFHNGYAEGFEDGANYILNKLKG